MFRTEIYSNNFTTGVFHSFQISIFLRKFAVASWPGCSSGRKLHKANLHIWAQIRVLVVAPVFRSGHAIWSVATDTELFCRVSLPMATLKVRIGHVWNFRRYRLFGQGKISTVAAGFFLNSEIRKINNFLVMVNLGNCVFIFWGEILGQKMWCFSSAFWPC